ncbi:MAG: hypothetical protein IPN86_08955 [Saprospiraceae bacterium]|nr:hypothetical protein [Saprospiraceae bacterium]
MEEIQLITGEIKDKNIEIEKTKEKNIAVLSQTTINIKTLELEQKKGCYHQKTI